MDRNPTRGEVDRAGEILRAGVDMNPEFSRAMEVLGAWRGMHVLPLQAVNMRLRRVVAHNYPRPIVAKRLKRMSSIVAKLQRFPDMKASRIQDIGGVRVIVDSVREVYELRDRIAVGGRRTHLCGGKDYVAQPKPDGYRSLHQIFRYTKSDQLALRNMQIELQLRTRLQHAWATAVETLGIIERAPFKTGQGQESHRRFFRLASALFSHAEGSPVLAEYAALKPAQLVTELERLDNEIKARAKLRALTVNVGRDALTAGKKTGLFLMILDTADNVEGFTLLKQRIDMPAMALTLFNAIEQQYANDPTKTTLLVSLDNIQDLRQAYPNYYLDASLFLESLARVCDTYRA